LPESGDVTIGRASTCDIQIDEGSVSPLHAVIHLDREPTIEDLDSDSGTQVGEARILPRQPVNLVPGELIKLGAVMLIFQRRMNARPRRIWTHGYFESRLEEECTRADFYHKDFALLRLHFDRAFSQSVIEETLANILRAVDVVGSYGPGEYEVILNEAHPEGADLVRNRILSILSTKDPTLRIGIACYPRDGRSPDVLTATAADASRLATTIAETPQVIDSTAQAAATGSIQLSKSMQHLDQLVERIAASTINVLIMGETGVGKDVFAEKIHRLSLRRGSAMLRLNCASLSESLLESELFGHERGAFTGAVQSKPGLLETANGGTIFLDEIGELPLSIQVKLLRVLEERVVLPVGSVKPRAIDVRFLAGTNRDLELEVARGTFRQDLFFRLNGISIVIPPLRDRISEIEGLAKLFISEICLKTGQDPEPLLSRDALQLMEQYAWPGNVRELRNIVERAVLLCSDGKITLAHLPVEKMSASFAPRRSSPPVKIWPVRESASDTAAEVVDSPPEPTHPQPLAAPAAAADSAEEAATGPRRRGLYIPQDLQSEMLARERQQIMDALSACAGNQTRASKMLGISRRTLVNRLNMHGISGPRKSRKPAP
jgi:transcriptional regulator with PAS, ATPase and Fis domain